MMSYSIYYSLFPFYCFLLIIISTNCLAKTTFHPKTLFLAVKKDPSSLQYITEIQQRTPLVPLKLAIHLAGDSLWVDCENGYKSSTYKPSRCKSKQCKLASTTQCGECLLGFVQRGPGCNKDACYNHVENPLVEILTSGEIADDVLSIQSINESFPGPVATIPKFIFSCAGSYVTQDLGKDVKGTVGFGHQSAVSVPAQFASAFKFSRKFAICLSSSTERNGIIFIGNSPYLLNSAIDASRDLIYTPILTSPYDIVRDKKSSEYYIKVSSISINGKNVPLNKTLLSLKNGFGTSISTAVPYTIMLPSIYNAITKAFVNEMPKEVRSVPPVEPFTTCFNSRDIGISRLGFNAPEINVALDNKNVNWRITGANSLVKVNEDVICLAFVERRTRDWGQGIVIGAYQMQDNLVEFDLSRRRIGFSNSLFFRQTMCSNQNYT
nr:PREDICTED: basic 7S globulin-like [Nicotiana tabacum]